MGFGYRNVGELKVHFGHNKAQPICGARAVNLQTRSSWDMVTCKSCRSYLVTEPK